MPPSGTRTNEQLFNQALRKAVVKGEKPTKTSKVEGRCPPGYLTKSMLCKRLNITEAELRWFERRNIIAHSLVEEKNGWRLYDESIVEEFLTKERPNDKKPPRDEPAPAKFGVATKDSDSQAYTDEQGRKGFKLLKGGMSLEDIVLETGYHPGVVRSIARDYVALSGTILLSRATLDKIHKLPLQGELPMTDENGVYTLFKSYAEATCTVCKRRPPAHVCSPCIREKFAKMNAEAAKAPTLNGAAP